MIAVQRKKRKNFKHALEFLQEEVGADNIFSAVVHMDERNPHMHLCFVPLTKDKRHTYSHLDFSSKQESAKAISAAFGKQDEPVVDKPECEEAEAVQEEEEK